MIKNKEFYTSYPLHRQVRFTLVNVFHESVSFTRTYTLPFNMLSVCIRSEDEDASVARNLKTGEVYRNRENDIAMIPFNLSQEYRHTLRNERYGIHFKLELYPGIDVFNGLDHRIVENSPELRREADRIFQIKDPFLMLSRCTEFALEFSHRHWPEHYHIDIEKIKRYEPLLHELKNSIDAELRVEHMAEKRHRSIGNFTREFHEVFHQTPKHYIQTELFRKAAIMLLSPDETVKSVADKLNFSSEFYFSRFFKRISGISPKDYRETSKKA